MSCSLLLLFAYQLGNPYLHLASLSLRRSPLRLPISHQTVLGRVVNVIRSTLLPCDEGRLIGITSRVSRHGGASYKPSAFIDFEFLC